MAVGVGAATGICSTYWVGQNSWRIERLRIPETTIWLAEYGDTNHTWCATIFANASDRTVVRSIGERIYNRGGMDALQANFYILYHGFIADEEEEEEENEEEED